MSELIKGITIRISKLFHYIFTIALFYGYYHLSEISRQGRGSITIHFWTIMCMYAVLLLFSMRAYSSYNVGISRIRMLVYSQFLADLVTAGIIYILFSVDCFAFINPLPLFVLIAVQFVFNCIWSYSVNTLCLRMHKPKRTVIVYRSQADLRRIEEVFNHKHKFNIIRSIENPSGDIHSLMQEITDAEAVFVSGINADLRNGIAKFCVEKDIYCYIAPHVGDVIMMGASHMELFSVPIFRISRAAPNIEYLIAKRVTDIIGSLVGILVFSPFILATALAVKLYDGGPVLYKQVRLTKDGKRFNILKFRSMSVNAEKDGVARLASENDSRITPVGKVIRACRFDELPQLFNILAGDMSIVGPRPERPEIAEQYEETIPAFVLRLQVKAGLTGFAQVYGKYNTDPYDKLRMDLMYISKMSFVEDIKLIFATVKVLFMKESTSGVASGQTTAVKKDETNEYILK